MAQTFNNGESNASVRTKLNANAEEINEIVDEIIPTLAPLASPTFTGTVSGVTKSMIGLDNVDNTSDVNKPISALTANALVLRMPTILISQEDYDELDPPAENTIYFIPLS